MKFLKNRHLLKLKKYTYDFAFAASPEKLWQRPLNAFKKCISLTGLKFPEVCIANVGFQKRYNIFLLFVIFYNDQMLDASQFLYKKNIAHNNPQSAQRLTEESLITPEMQWSILSFLGASQMTINRVTGQVQGLPSVETLLMQINQKLSTPMYSAQKESFKQAVHALLEATDIALIVTAIEAIYQPYNTQSTNQLLAQLNAQKQTLNNTIAAINKIQTIDSAPSSSYFSWIPYFGSGSAQPVVQLSSQQIPFDPSSATVDIPASLMPTIIKINDYKEMSADPVQAANLLFKECFIAQQHHLKDNARIENLKINLQSPISAQNYIFTQFANLYNSYTGTYPICQIAQQMVASQAPRYDLQAPVNAHQQQAHQLLLHIRQAIQTALYIANKKSSYNAGSMLSSSITSWLDGIVSQLMKADAQLALMCKDPLYGATQADIDREAGWSTTAKIVGGLVAVTAVIAIDTMTTGYGKKALNMVFDATYGKNFNPLDITAGNTPVQGPQLPSSPTTGLQTLERFLPSSATSAAGNPPVPGTGTDDKPKDKAPTWTDRAGQVWGATSNAAGSAAKLGAVTLAATQGAKFLENKGIISQGSYNYATGGYGDVIEDVAKKSLLYGGGLAGSMGALEQGANAWNKWGTENSPNTKAFLPAKFWDTVDLLQAGPSAIGTAVGAVGTATMLATQGLSTLTSQQQFNQPQQRVQQNPNQAQNNPPVQQIAPQQIYQALSGMVHDAPAQGTDPFATLMEGIKIVDSQRMADAQTVVMILQQIQMDNAANLEFAEKVGQLTQAIAQNQQPAQAA
jgi:hypothetical protein